MSQDPYIAAFSSGDVCPDVFHGVAHRHQIWREDPLDIVSIHEEPREQFEQMLNRATTPPGLPYGRVLLLLGEAGCGKTHLMRAFRNHAHRQELGYFGYMQMTSAVDDYGRYVLHNLIESLDKPYYEPRGEASGLGRLSARLLSCSGLPAARIETLRDGELDGDALHDLVHELADDLVCQPALAGIDLDLLRALVYLQRDDPRLKARILRYLRCDDLAAHDRAHLGGLVPRPHDSALMVELLGRLAAAFESSSCLILCLDQLEDIYHRNEAELHFRRALSTVCGLADRVPSSIVLIACLEDFYKELKSSLTQSVLDRVEHDPRPIRLESRRTAEEAEQIVGVRIEQLYEMAGLGSPPDDPTYPLGPDKMRQLAGMPTRALLGQCQQWRQAYILGGDSRSAAEQPSATTQAECAPTIVALEQSWNDFRSEGAHLPPDGEAAQAALLAWAIERSGEELGQNPIHATPGERTIEISSPLEEIVVAICNGAAQGGHLGRRIEELMGQAGARTPVVVRNTNFPANPRTKIATTIGKLVGSGGRRVVAEDSEWRTIVALQAFQRAYAGRAEFAPWLRAERPLSQLHTLRVVLGLDLPRTIQATPDPAQPAPALTAEVAVVAPNGLVLGTSSGLRAAPFALRPEELTRHAAFLGGTGSGKTTIALRLLEQLLERGVPAVMVDRKGDLCSYADPQAWSRPLGAPQEQARRDRLRERLDIALYTPGDPRGRPLSISIVPPGFEQADSFEQEQIARMAASALVGMLGLQPERGAGRNYLAVLSVAIRVLGRLALEPDLPNLIRLIGDRDPSLLAELGVMDAKLLNRLAQDLEIARINHGLLLSSDHERLDMQRLFGMDGSTGAGRTRLSIISTKFLPGESTALFWVAQLLIQAVQWMSRHPSGELQALLFLDEADLYLPARSQPATKEPMENLLKRARSAGLGLLLATQSPGDLDYKCRENIRTWFLGRINQDRALGKLKPLLGEGSDGARLAGQAPGEFLVVRESARDPIRADCSLIAAGQLSEQEILALARRAAER